MQSTTPLAESMAIHPEILKIVSSIDLTAQGTHALSLWAPKDAEFGNHSEKSPISISGKRSSPSLCKKKRRHSNA